MSKLQMMDDGLVSTKAVKWSTHFDTFRNRWVLERDGKQVASFPQDEEALCNQMAKAGNERSLDVC